MSVTDVRGEVRGDRRHGRRRRRSSTGSTPTSAHELLALGHVRRYPAQSIIFFEGDAAHDVVLIRTGDLKISATVEDREVVLDVLGPGDILGEVAAIDGLPRSATLTTLTAAEVLRIPAAAFMDHLATRTRRRRSS